MYIEFDIKISSVLVNVLFIGLATEWPGEFVKKSPTM
jgi:hypothetical protein